MITVNTNGQALSQAFVDALTDPALRYDAKLLMNGVELNGLIDSVTITEGSCGDEGAFSVGSVVGSTMVAVVADLRDIVKGQEIEVHIGVMTDAEAETYEYVRMGYFNVSACPRNANKTTITAYGRTVTKTACAFTPPATKTIANIVANLKSDIQAAYGLNVPITVSGVSTSRTVGGTLEGLTCYQVLQILASAVGGYATDTPDGGIIIKKLTNTVSLSTNTDRMVMLPVVEENDFEITGVSCRVSEETEVEVDEQLPQTSGYSLQLYGSQAGGSYSNSRTVTYRTGYRTAGEEFFYSGTISTEILEYETQVWDKSEETFEATFVWGTSSEEVIIDHDDGDVVLTAKLVYNAAANTMTLALSGTVSSDYYAIWGAACGYARYSSKIVPAVAYSYGSPVTLSVENPYMTQSLFDAGLKTLVGYRYRPGTASLTYGDPRLEGTDVVEITDINGDVYSLPCHSLVHKYTGGLTSTITAAVATFEENDISTALPITSSIADVASSALAAKVSADAAAVSADSANKSALSASASAAGASESAQYAAAQAVEADQEAKRAKTAADEAVDQAQIATQSADSALVGLSTVQDVVGVLNWITEHGTMTSQSGGTFDSNQVYFVQDNNGDYTVGGTRYSLVAEPKAEDINSYYVLSVDKSVQNYVATHIVVDSEGLWIIPDGTTATSGNKVLIATGGTGHTYPDAGTYIIGKVNGVNTVIAKFLTSGITIGEEDSGHIVLTDSLLSMAFLRNNAPVETFKVQNGWLTIKDVSHMIQPASDAVLGFGMGTSDHYKFVFSGPEFAFAQPVYMRDGIEVDEQTTLYGGSSAKTYFPGTMGTANHEECPLAVEGGFENFFSVVVDPVDSGGGKCTSEIITALEGYQTTGNVDKTIYDALNSLGWLSDCTES